MPSVIPPLSPELKATLRACVSVVTTDNDDLLGEAEAALEAQLLVECRMGEVDAIESIDDERGGHIATGKTGWILTIVFECAEMPLILAIEDGQ